MGTLPVPPKQKGSPPEGFTGRHGATPTDEQVEQWRCERGDWNPVLRFGTHVIGLDLDLYKRPEARVDLEGLLGCELPATWSSSSHDDGSGIYLYLVPPSPKGKRWKTAPVPGVDTIQHGHRYTMVWPAVHPEGHAYVWRDNGEVVEAIPTPDDLAELPLGAVDALLEDDPDYATREAVTFDLTGGEPSDRVRTPPTPRRRGVRQPERHVAA